MASRWSNPPPSRTSSRRRWPIASSMSSEHVWKELDVTNDDFIRTTEPRHKAGGAKDRPAACWIRTTSTWASTRAGTTKARKNSSPKPRQGSGIQIRDQRPPAGSLSSRRAISSGSPNTSPRVLDYIKANPDFVQPDVAAERSAQQVGSRGGGPIHQPGDAEVGHPDAQRSATCRLCLDRRIEQLHHRARLRLRQRLALRQILAGQSSPDRQGNSLVSRRLLAGDVVRAGPAAAASMSSPTAGGPPTGRR